MVIRPSHLDLAGFSLTGEIRLRPDSMWHSGSHFHELQYPVLAGAGVLLDGLPVRSGINLLNSSPGSLALAVAYICDHFVSLVVAYSCCS